MIPFSDDADATPRDILVRAGEVFAVFDATTQDSGNTSYGVRVGSQRYFVKTAGAPADRAVLDHPARVELLRNAVRVHRDGLVGAMPSLHGSMESAWGPMLVYDWVDGELLYAEQARRDDPDHAHQRFLRRPADEIRAVLDVVFDHHARLAAAGWVAIDFYDGCLLYDFAGRRPWIIDLDSYHHGPTVARRGLMFGSSRFMAPEEHVDGATIDERSTVFTLGRTAAVLLARGSLVAEDWRGTVDEHAVVTRACQAERASRFPSVAAFVAAWRGVRSGSVVTELV